MNYINLFYVVAGVAFILGLKKLSHPKTARNGNQIASVGMLIAIVVTLIAAEKVSYQLVIIGMVVGGTIGAFFAVKVQMTAMPQMVAIFNGFGGGASALVAAADFMKNADALAAGSDIIVGTFVISPIFYGAVVAFSIFVGTLTFTGSFIAFGKLQGFISGQPITFPMQQAINAILALAMLTGVVMMAIAYDKY